MLVIVGLLLGGLLKGPELVHSARAKVLARDFGAVATQLDAYQDRFKALPGDDARADANVGGTPATTPPTPAQRGNGRIEGAWNSRTPTDESYLFWQHLRRANLTGGSTDAATMDTYLPRNAEAGRLGVSSLLPGGWAAAYFVCSANINGRLARQIDLQLDDGNTATGSVRIFANDAGDGGETAPVLANLTAIADANLYTVCAAY